MNTEFIERETATVLAIKNMTAIPRQGDTVSIGTFTGFVIEVVWAVSLAKDAPFTVSVYLERIHVTFEQAGPATANR